MVYAKVREIPEMVHEKQPKYQKWYMDTKNGICESRGNTRNGTYILWNKDQIMYKKGEKLWREKW